MRLKYELIILFLINVMYACNYNLILKNMAFTTVLLIYLSDHVSHYMQEKLLLYQFSVIYITGVLFNSRKRSVSH